MENKEFIKAIKEYKNNNNIIDKANELGLQVNKYGKCICPFHSDTNPSLQLYQNTNTFKCYACGAKGDILDLEEKIMNKNTTDIINYRKKQYAVKEERLFNYIKENIKYLEDDFFIFERAHFYHDEDNNIISVKIIYKNEKKEKAALQFSVKNNYKLEKMENHQYIYNYNNVIKAKKENKQIFIVEGEKDADTLNKLGLVATTSRYGALSVKYEEFRCLYDTNIIIIPDYDKAGCIYAEKLSNELLEKSKTLKILELGDLRQKEDVTDWINKGHGKAELESIINKTIDLKLKDTVENMILLI